MTSTLAQIVTAAAVLIMPASAAAAPALGPLRPCYDAVSRDAGGTEPVVVAGTGFAPGSLVDVAVDGVVQYTGVPADADGSLTGSIPAPYVASGQRTFTVTVTQEGAPDQSVTATSLVTRLHVQLTPKASRPSARVRFRGSGFTADAPVYVHYVRRGRVRATRRLADDPDDPCGRFDVRRRQFPFAPSVGRWLLQIDQHRHFRRKPTSAFLQLAVRIRPADGR